MMKTPASFLRATGLALAVAAFGMTGPALAAGDGGDSDAPTCRSGLVYDSNKKMCVPDTSAFDDGQRYIIGRDLALAGEYDRAIGMLEVIDSKDAMTLTMLGYAHRKSGRFDEGFALYHQALAIEPDNLNTLEYLGEGYAATGDTLGAVTQLAKLKQLCGTECSQYQQLAAVIGDELNW